MPQPFHVRAINKIVFRYHLLTASRKGLLSIVLAVLVAFQMFGAQTSNADAGIIGDGLKIIGGGPGALFGGIGDLAGAVGGKALKEALEWLFGGLEETITLAAMRSVTKIIELPDLVNSNNSLVAALYIMSIPIFLIGTMFSVSQAMYGSMGSSEPLGGYGRVIVRTTLLVVVAAAWYPIVQLLVLVTNDLSRYLLSNEVLGQTVRDSFAEAKTDKLAPILMLLVYLVLAVSWLLLVVAKGVLTLSFVMLALGGPVILALSTYPPARGLANWLMTTIATLIAIPALWAFVFGAWAFVGSSLASESIPDSPNQLYKASLFIAAMLAIYGITKRALAMGRMGIPAGVPGGGIAKMGMGLAAAYAGKNVAAGIMSKGTATQTVSHALPDGSTVSQKSTLRGAAAKSAMDAGAKHSADPSSAKAQNTAAHQASVAQRQQRLEADKTAAGAAARPGTVAAPGPAVHPGGNTMNYDKNGSLVGPAGETQARHKAGWDSTISAATAPGSARPSEASVKQAGAAFSSADRAAFHQLATEAGGEGRNEAQAQAHFSDRMAKVMSGSNVGPKSSLAPDGLTIATASPATAAAAFAPAAATQAGGNTAAGAAFAPAGPIQAGSGPGASASNAAPSPMGGAPTPAEPPTTYNLWKSDGEGRPADVATASERLANAEAVMEKSKGKMSEPPAS